MATPFTVTVTGRLMKDDNAPDIGGVVQFARPVPFSHPDGTVYEPIVERATAGADGSFSLQLAACNDAAWSPINWTYTVTVKPADGGKPWVFSAFVDVAQGAAVTFGTLAHVDSPATPQLYALANHTHTDFADKASTWPVSNPLTQNFVGWSGDPNDAQNATVMGTSGLLVGQRVRVMASPITNISLYLTAGGVSLTAGRCIAALYTDAGALLGWTSDQATAWATAGLKTMALVTPQVVTPGTWVRPCWWFAGTTGPTVARFGASAPALLNAGLVSPNLRTFSANSGLTTTPPATLGTQTPTGPVFWVGLS